MAIIESFDWCNFIKSTLTSALDKEFEAEKLKKIIIDDQSTTLDITFTAALTSPPTLI